MSIRSSISVLLAAITVATVGVATLTRPRPELALSDPGLAKQDGQLYHLGAPFSGIVVERDDDGQQRQRTPYLDGRIDGVVESWFENGQLAAARDYEAGRKTGTHRGFWPDGSRRFASSYESGWYHGTVETWYANGRRYELKHYAHGDEVGTHRSWTPTGAVKANYVVRDGRRYGLIGSRPCYRVEGEPS